VIASIVIILVSSVMFLHFFRYTCLLLINKGNQRCQAVASTIRLSFPQVKEALAAQTHTASLDHLHQSLEKDYQLLMDVLGQATGSSDPIERRILDIDYKVMQSWYKMTRTSKNLAQAKMALSDMSSILNYFAAEIAESAAA
jgi:hypothetical protein